MIIILSAPSGSGKTSIAKMLLQEDKQIVLSVSATTRSPRLSEQDSVDYFFKTTEEFQAMQDSNQLLEFAEIYGNLYGTPKDYVQNALQDNLDVLFDIDYQGAKQIINNTRIASHKLDTLDATRIISIFVQPPDIATLKSRLMMRNQDTMESIQERIALASQEMLDAKHYKYVITNDNLINAVKQVQHIIAQERLNTTS